MTRNLFQNINAATLFTDILPLSFNAKFFENFQIIVERNNHMNDDFIPSLVSCLYYFISVCTNNFTFPGCVFIPINPHPKENQYHTMFCVESIIMYMWEFFESKDCPKELLIPQSRRVMGTLTMVLMWRLMQSFCITVKTLIMSNGFCL